MANQVKKKWIGNDEIDSTKILLDNNTAIRGKDSTDATQSLIKIDATDKLIVYRSSGDEEIAYKSDITDIIDDSALSTTTTYSSQKSDDEFVNASGDSMTGNLAMGGNKVTGLAVSTANGEALVYDQLGAANGVAPLNGSSKIDASYLPSYVDDVLEYADFASLPVTGETVKIYVTLDTNKTYRWSGSVYVEISPSEVTSVNGQTGVVTLDSDDISEGSTNLYFTDTRAKTAAVSDTAYGAGWNGVTDVAASKNAVYDQVELERARILALENVSPEIYKKVLIAGDITNEYIDLPHEAIETNDFHVFVDRLAIHQGAAEDYTLSIEGGVTRITFLNDMVSPGNQSLSAGDSIYVRYKRSL